MKDLFGILVIASVNDKSCDFGEYLDCENCKCRKRLVDKLVEECIENIDEAKIAGITFAKDENKHKNKCSSCTPYVVLFSIIFTFNIAIGTYFICNKYMNRNEETVSRYYYVYETINY